MPILRGEELNLPAEPTALDNCRGGSIKMQKNGGAGFDLRRNNGNRKRLCECVD